MFKGERELTCIEKSIGKSLENNADPTFLREQEKKIYRLTLDEHGWLVLNGKPLRRTRFAKDWK